MESDFWNEVFTSSSPDCAHAESPGLLQKLMGPLDRKGTQGSLEAQTEEFELCSADNRLSWAPSSCFSLSSVLLLPSFYL